MKKLLAFTLILVLCLSVVLVACNDKDDNNVKKLTAPADQLEAAKNAFEKTYTTDLIPEETDVDFTVPKAVPYGGLYSFPITWTVSDSRITIDKHSDTEVLVNIPEESKDEIKYTLTATITADDGTTATVEFERTVPEFKLYDYEGYVNAAKNATVNIDGIITAILPKDNGASNSGFYMNTVDKDGKPNGGVYVYNPKASTSDLRIGMTVRAAGKKDVYNGTHELINARRFTILDSTIKTVEPVDYTEAFKNAKDLSDAALTDKQSMLVTIKGVDIREVGTDETYHYFSLDGKKTYVRISSSSCPLTTAEQETFAQTFAANKGSKADVTGIVTIFSGNFYLTPATVNVFTNITKVDYTAEQKVDRAIKDLSIETLVERNCEVTLADKSDLHEDVTITWAFKEGTTPTTAVLNNNVIKYTQGAKDENVELVATFKSGNVIKTANYVVAVKKLAANTFIKMALDAASELADKAATTESYILIGTVSRIKDAYSETYKNISFYLSDGVQEVLVYRYNLDDAKDIKVGDSLAIAAPMKKYGSDLEAVSTFVKLNVTDIETAAAAGIAGTGEDGTMVYGQITKIGTAYSAEYKNITVTITDGTGSIDCFRLTGGEDLKVGDYILVTGKPSAYKGAAQMAQGATYISNGIYVAPTAEEETK